MPDERDAGSLQHMLNAIARIGDYTAGLDLLTFSQVPVVQDAVIRQLMVLGEAANRVSRAMQAQSADVPWRDIIALRNVIVHQYEKINLERIWVTVHDDLPPVEKRISDLLASVDQEPPPSDSALDEHV
jgi:uncharacterized protein with HEPN domain